MMLSTDVPRKAAIYLRISQDREMDGLAIERQREDCENLAQLKRWEVVETYVDQSKSATDRTKNRPDYDRMVRDYDAGLFDAIICYDLDRLTRQPRQLEEWIERAETGGLALVTANGDGDLTNDAGRLFLRIKAAVARSEVERKSARQSRAQRQRAEQGRAPKGMRPLGYAIDGTVIESEAQIVREIFDGFTRLESPESLRSLARCLTERGVPRHSHVVSVERAVKRVEEGLEPREIKPDGAWTPSTISGILHNPRYAGLSTYTPKDILRDGARRRSWKAQILRDDAGEPVLGQWDAIVSAETWWKAQEILDDEGRVTNTSGSTKRVRLGSGLYRCGLADDDGQVCGKKVTGAPRGYRCAGHINRAGPAIDEFVMTVIAARLARDDVRELVPRPGDDAQASGVRHAISEQRARITRAQRDYDDGLIEAADLKRNRDRAETRIEELESQLTMRGRGGALMPVLGHDDPAQAFRDGSLDMRRSIIDVLCSVTLLPQPRGRKGFDPESVVIEWAG